ncbi:hypothetical protein [Yoonia maritima]|uniref:DUF7742 family protein n=1 Tax=Yoonia maritima TaxID=1435347 RepID=UPI003734F7D1
MRPVQLADLEVAVRVLLAVPVHARHQMVIQLYQEASIAEQYRKTTGKLHPLYGNGTLMSAAQKHAMMPRNAFCDPDYLRCMAILATELSVDRDR